MISPVKGQVEAIRAFARVSAKHENVSLVVAGSGSEEDLRSCVALVDRLGLREKVKFTGYVADPFTLLTQADAILVCSKVEAMGPVTPEAMAASKPVILYANDGALEMIEHEVNGLLYSSGAEMVSSQRADPSCSPLAAERPLVINRGWTVLYKPTTWIASTLPCAERPVREPSHSLVLLKGQTIFLLS